MKFIIFILLLFLLFLVNRPAFARVFLISNGQNLPGEFGFLMGGAQAALASGGESFAFNPAGLVRETGEQLSVGGLLLRFQKLGTGAGEISEFTSTPANISWSGEISQGRGFPRFAYGISLVQTLENRFPSIIDDLRTGGTEALPFGLGGPPAAFNTDFPNGVQVSETSDGLGELSITSSSLGLAVAMADWARLGFAVRLERVHLAQRSQMALEFSGSSGPLTLEGQSLTAWMVEGDAERISYSLGVQMSLGEGLSFGAAVFFPTRTLSGNGRVSLRHNSRLATAGGGSVPSNNLAVVIDSRGLPFRLERPRVVNIGLAFVSDWFLAEFDLIQVDNLGPYQVLPATDSRPPSTQPVQQPALTTSSEGALNFSVGMAFLQSERTSWLVGLTSDQSPVPADDPVFRKVDLTTLALGVYHVRGRFSGTLGFSFQQADASQLSFPASDGSAPIFRRVRLSSTGFHATGSMGF